MKKYILFLTFSLLVFDFSKAQPVIQWQKSYGGSAADGASCIQQTTDSGYVVAGYIGSNDSDVTAYYGNTDFRL